MTNRKKEKENPDDEEKDENEKDEEEKPDLEDDKEEDREEIAEEYNVSSKDVIHVKRDDPDKVTEHENFASAAKFDKKYKDIYMLREKDSLYLESNRKRQRRKKRRNRK